MADAAARSAPGVVILGGTPMIRDALRILCEERLNLRVVASTGDPDEAAAWTARAGADVAILDLGRPAAGGLDAVEELRRARPGIRVLALDDEGEGDGDGALAAVRAGVLGYVERSAPVEQIERAIAAVAAGDPAMVVRNPDGPVRRIGTLIDRTRAAARVSWQVTPREREVLRLIAQGMTSRQVAGALGLSVATVDSHVAHLYQKLRVRTRVQAVRRGVALGLVDLSLPLTPAAAAEE